MNFNNLAQSSEINEQEIIILYNKELTILIGINMKDGKQECEYCGKKVEVESLGSHQVQCIDNIIEDPITKFDEYSKLDWFFVNDYTKYPQIISNDFLKEKISKIDKLIGKI